MTTVEEYQRREELLGKAFQKIQSVMKNIGLDCKLKIVCESANHTYAMLNIKSDRNDVPDVCETYYVDGWICCENNS